MSVSEALAVAHANGWKIEYLPERFTYRLTRAGKALALTDEELYLYRITSEKVRQKLAQACGEASEYVSGDEQGSGILAPRGQFLDL